MRILYVDDEADLREIFKVFLESHGHTVITAADGVEALRKYFDHSDEYDFVLTDYQMPRKNGVVLLMEIHKLNPAQRMAIYSGDPPSLPKEIEGTLLLQKPIRMADLLKVIEG